METTKLEDYINPARAKLMTVQQKLRVPKDRRNSLWGYAFRNASDILEAVKPFLEEVQATIVLSDEVKTIGEGAERRFYVVGSATFFDTETGGSVSVNGWAREELSKKGMDAAQLTGACSSYARKYALCGLLAIDDSRLDPDETSKGDGKTGGNAPAPQEPTTTAAPKAAAPTEDALTAKKREAWTLFCSTDVARKSDENARSKFFFALVMKVSGALNPKAIPAEGWDKVIEHLKKGAN